MVTKHFHRGILLLAALAPMTAWPSVANISAQFTVDRTAGSNQHFINTTPLSGFCKNWSALCESSGVFSVDAGLTGTKHWTPGPDHADGLMVSISGNQRPVTVSKGGDVHTLQFRINAHSLRVERLPGTPALAFAMFNPGTVGHPLGGCNFVTYPNGTGNYIHNIWKIPEQNVTCYSPLKKDAEPREVRYLPTFGYELIAPNPLEMHSGTYTGEIVYSVGPGRDIDYHNTARMSDSEIRFRLTLEVAHDLKIDFPDAAAGHLVRADLEPNGGWQAWQNGQMPPEVRRDVPFRISLSGPATVGMACSMSLNASCAITNGQASIPLNVTMSLPGLGFGKAANAGERMPIPITPLPPLSFNAGAHRLIAEQGLIHISSPGPFQPATTYNGQITLIFDSDG